MLMTYSIGALKKSVNNNTIKKKKHYKRTRILVVNNCFLVFKLLRFYF